MEVHRVSPISGKSHVWDIDISEDQYKAWESGEDLIQDAMPNITSEEREFILTGIVPQEWQTIFEGDEN